MKIRKLSYKIVNVIFILCAFALLANICITNTKLFDRYISKTTVVLLVLVFAVFFILVHIVKLFRFYLILLSENIGFKRFIKVYIKTTFVNILLPFKTGEIFRFYCYSNETNNYKIGLLSILVERFFDTCALLIVLIPIELYTIHSLSKLSILLLIFIVSLLLIFALFQGFYDYMNRFFIFNVYSNKSIQGLKVLEMLNHWYQYIKKLIYGRSFFIFGLSLVAWLTELLMFYSIFGLIRVEFSLKTFSGYINSAFTNGSNSLLTLYSIGASILFAITVILVYRPDKRKRCEND